MAISYGRNPNLASQMLGTSSSITNATKPKKTTKKKTTASAADYQYGSTYGKGPTSSKKTQTMVSNSIKNDTLPKVSGTLNSATGNKVNSSLVTKNPYQGSAHSTSKDPKNQIKHQMDNATAIAPNVTGRPIGSGSGSGGSGSGSGSGGSGVGGGGYIPQVKPEPPVEVRKDYKPDWLPELRTADELAKLWGIQIDKDYYSGMLNKGTNEYFDQMNTEMLRAENNAYDMLAQNYELTRDDIKQRRQMALSEGATSGQLAAQELATLMGAQQSSGAVATDMLGSYYDLAQQKATTLEENIKLAMQMEQEARAGLGNIANQIYSVDTQRYAADSTALSQITAAEYAKAAQLGAANISANATTAAANAQAAASKYAADRNAAVQSQLASSQYLNDYFNAQYSNQAKYYPQQTYKK